MKKIVYLMLETMRKRLQENEYEVEVTDEAALFIAKKGYDPSFGARPLRRAIQRMVEDELSEAILRGDFKPGDTILVSVLDEKIKLEKK